MARGFRTRLKGLTESTLDYLQDVVAGTSAASKAVVLDSSSKINTIDVTSLKLGGTTVGATAAEVNQVADISAYQETVAAAGALSITARVSKLALTSAGAVTLAAPDSTCIGYVKIVQMTTDNGDVTLALTNVVGQSSGTTATFNDVGDSLTLIAGANSKWIVLKEQGISLA